MAFSLKAELFKLEWPSQTDDWLPTLVKISPVVLKNNIFKYWSLFSLSFANHLPMGEGVTFNLINHQNMHCAKFGWNWPNGYGEKTSSKLEKFKDRKNIERAAD